MNNKEHETGQLRVESFEQNKDVIEMTKMILAQNERILKMNESLLAVLSSPVISKDVIDKMKKSPLPLQSLYPAQSPGLHGEQGF